MPVMMRPSQALLLPRGRAPIQDSMAAVSQPGAPSAVRQGADPEFHGILVEGHIFYLAMVLHDCEGQVFYEATFVLTSAILSLAPMLHEHQGSC